MVQFTFEQVLSIQAEQVNGKNADIETTLSQFTKAMPENNLLEDDNSVVAKFATTAKDGKKYNVEYYNLDVIMSVGYRVKSSQGIVFRKWANKILKDYMLKGYAINQKRLEYLEKTIKLIDIANRIDERLEGNDAKEILKVIGGYSKALNLLDDYDHRTLKKFEGNIDDRKIEYQECINIINKLRFNEESSLFAVERDKGLESIIGNIYQSFARTGYLQKYRRKRIKFFIFNSKKSCICRWQ